ncbi:Gamma-glutamyltranspeptidase [Staphylococcus petrasii]|uniref:Glutathione hydrolase proenzyme n=1 Tax=Staphylococcus petrasii TaxID=1276936 RepID=A0A380G487_9STAP|nr:gamma-glutamyltransferase [Staphylococcus petrasii]PNZ30845.1 gamma-glutamyltransferase [Staphylococcus petrasii]TGE11084.1 gamma-glutamyltransferase [Staphylococcus petrasii]TGE16487.1 gamma-glutamyltransferase [Staphylococcus petrasii]SUM45078.1 Gamma-glutamyltranspeptidase [Staphylococcus petrasii]
MSESKNQQLQYLTSKEGLISVSHPLAAEVGKRILDQGGNAIDAVIAIQMSLNVVEPFTSGIGGGGYLLYYDNSSGEITSFDARETAPGKVDTSFYLDKEGNYKSFFELSTHGSIVAVPGIPRLFEYLHEHYSNLSLAELIDPAIEQAEKGYRANWATEKYSWHQFKRIQKFPETHKVYTNNQGSYFHEGDWIQLPDLARTFRIFKEEGFGAFYNGDIAKQLVHTVSENGGTITEDDLANYQIRIKKPVKASYRGYEINSMGPSSSGGITIIQILKLLEQFDIKKMGPRSIDYLHHLIQAMHIAYSDRAHYVADDDYYKVPIEQLIDSDYLKQRSTLINETFANFDIQHGTTIPNVEAHTYIDEQHTETTHFSVTDKYGNVASFTTSIGMIYGSGMTIPNYGVLLNTTIDGFDVVPGGINEIEAHKRSLSNMAPTIVMKDGNPFLEVGAPGAISIIASIVQTIINVIDFDMTIQEAIDEPRIYSSNPSRIEWEPQFDQATIIKLVMKNHAFERTPEAYIGDVHGLQFIKDGVMGGTDDTREGTIIGGPVKVIRDKAPDIDKKAFSTYNINFNNVTLPLYKEQIFKEETTYWLQNDIAQLIFINDSAHIENEFQKQINEKVYVDIVKIAKSFNYKVETTDNSVSLFKDNEQRLNDKQSAYYRYDKESITR